MKNEKEDMKKIFAIIICVVCCSIVAAQPQYTLDQILDSARQNNIAIRSAKHKIESAQQLRKEAGYRTAKDFAEAIEVPPTTYARYEQSPDKIPLKQAWMIAVSSAPVVTASRATQTGF